MTNLTINTTDIVQSRNKGEQKIDTDNRKSCVISNIKSKRDLIFASALTLDVK